MKSSRSKFPERTCFEYLLGYLSQMTHSAALVIFDGLLDLLRPVHDEGPATHDRFINRLAAQKKRCRVLRTIDADVVACPVKNRYLRRANLFRAYLHRTLEYNQQGGVTFR